MARLLRAALLVAGLGVLGYGGYGFLTDPYITDPVSVLVWAGGALVVHDGWWLPLVCLVGACAVRGPVLRWWLIVAAAVTAVGLPAVLRAGMPRVNRTVLPLPYLRNLVLVLAATAGLALIVALARRWRGARGGVSRRAGPQTPSSGRPARGRKGSRE
ncbi:hypothetical protein [Kitasatospora viridis]|uniref:Uncharacterized protein n=1 Tax=Kitasatospora viridis TaxID=281105 RepID=A0A561TWD2_9ACTN|nr:hypothetical protein [Kitasatospora viridis]TWF91418.1 hypothetical protein FHX73_12533 [Kitasatospora viridis]